MNESFLCVFVDPKKEAHKNHKQNERKNHKDIPYNVIKST